MSESVYELVREVPGIDQEDQKALLLALEKGIIPNKFPEPRIMANKIAQLPGTKRIDVRVAAKDIVAGNARLADVADLQGEYLLRVMLPVARKALKVPPKKSIVKGLKRSIERDIVDRLRSKWLEMQDYAAQVKGGHISRDEAIEFILSMYSTGMIRFTAALDELFKVLSNKDKRKLISKALEGFVGYTSPDYREE